MFPPGIPGNDPRKLRREGPLSHRQTRKFAATLTSSGKETKIGESIDFVVDVAGIRQCWPDGNRKSHLFSMTYEWNVRDMEKHGGESGIRSFFAPMKSVSYRKYIAKNPVNAIDPRAPCPPLPASML